MQTADYLKGIGSIPFIVNVEIHGAGFQNKGAQLMLTTTCERLRNASPHCRPCMSQRFCAFKERGKHALFQTIQAPALWKIPFYLTKDVLSLVKNQTKVKAFPEIRQMTSDIVCFSATKCRYKDMLGVIGEKEMDALVDISGYGFGDSWPVSRHQMMLKRARNYWQRNKPVILLPQMFGPFIDAQRRQIFRKTSNYCTKIYAREEASYDWLKTIGVSEDKLGIAPDITIFCDPDVHKWQSPAKAKYACLVPNIKMLEQTDWGDRYVDMMIAAGKYLKENELKVFVVQHESGKGDAELVRTIKERLDGNATLFYHDDGQVLKKFIGESEVLIGSRYHSIVAALSQSVPALVMGWAHKYEELMKEFGVSDFILDKKQSSEMMRHKLSELLMREKFEQVVSGLKEAKTNMRQANRTMWQEVFEMLRMPNTV